MVLRFAIRFFANNAKMNAMGSLFPSFTNFFANLSFVKRNGNCSEREVPLLAKQTFRKWLADQEPLKSTFDKDNSICFVMNLPIIMMYK
jgi:hypothetical protein